MKRILRTIMAAAMLLIPAAAFAADGYVVTDISMYAGPDAGYPPVLVLAGGTPVNVQGCTAGWQWCDVISGPYRGWVPGSYIQYTYYNRPVYVMDYGAQIGIPIVAFSIASYWGRYYGNMSFYRDRDRWYGRPMPIRPPARPPGGGFRPQPGGGGYRPQPGGGGHRPQPQPRPQPGGGNRPPQGGHQPPPNNGNRPQPGGGGNRPPQQGGNRPPQQGGNRPAGGNARPAPKAAPKGEHGNDDHKNN